MGCRFFSCRPASRSGRLPEQARPGALRQLWREVSSDRVLMMAAALAFHALLGVLPALAAIAFVWPLIAGGAGIEQQLTLLRGIVPETTMTLIRDFAAAAPAALGLGIGLVVNLVVVLWTAQRAASGLITSLNVAYDVRETRGPLRRAVAAAGVAFGAILFLLLALALLAIVPAVLELLGRSPTRIMALARWPALALLFGVGAALLLAFAPNRDERVLRCVASGAGAATAIWLIGSAGFSLYVAHLGTFGRFYGALAGPVVLLLWFYVTGLALLGGAEVDALLTERTVGKRDSGLKRVLSERESGGGA